MVDKVVRRDKRGKKYRVGVIGCGKIGSLLENDSLRWHPCTHAGAFDRHPLTEIVAACDINSERLKVFGEKWRVKKLFHNYVDMLDVMKLEILSVASWTSTHSEIVITAAQKGVKAIFCEKPMATTVHEARSMISACKEQDVLLFINHERRWELDYERVRDFLKGEMLGKMRSVVGNVLTQATDTSLAEADYECSPLLHDGTHLVDIIHYLVGDITTVYGMYGSSVGDLSCGTIHAILQTTAGVPAYITVGGGSQFFSFEVDILGTAGRITVGNGFLNCWGTADSSKYEGFCDLSPLNIESENPSRNPFLHAVQHMVDCVENCAENISSGEDGEKALEVIEAISLSAKLGGRVIKLPMSSSGYTHLR